MKKTVATTALMLGLMSLTAVQAQSRNKMTNEHQTAATQFVEAGGTKYAYRILGNQEGIPLIMLQHFTGTMDDWDPAVTNGLAQQFKIVLFDNKGVSASEGQTPDNIAEMARNTIEFIKALGYTKVNLLGFSMGGFIAQQIALDEPQLVNRIILAGTGQKGGEGITDIVKPLTASGAMTPDEQKLYLFYAPSESSRELGRQSLARIHSRMVNRDPQATNETITAQLHAIIGWGQADQLALDQLKNIMQPVLIVNGNNDIVVPTINSYTLFQNLPNAKLSLFQDANHGAIFQFHEQFLMEAIFFLKEK
jgi:pimeloyl-ACP methyl ester carboxylesterase